MNSIGTLGRYQLVRHLAYGGMAEVFVATLIGEQGFSKQVVLKKILPRCGQDPTFVRMFIDEAVLAAKLNHPNIVSIFDFGQVKGVYFIVMEYLEGVDLSRLVKPSVQVSDTIPLTPHLSFSQIALIGEKIARALHYSHTLTGQDNNCLGIVHRDVSPHNILLSTNGEIKLTDFGIAKARERLYQTTGGILKGKLAYMSPEQAAAKKVDTFSDQFSLGLVLWECLTHRKAYRSSSDYDLLKLVTRAQLPCLTDFCPQAPSALVQIIERSLSYKKSDRYEDLSVVADSLAACRYTLSSDGGEVAEQSLMELICNAQVQRQRTTVALTRAFTKNIPMLSHLVKQYLSRLKGLVKESDLKKKKCFDQPIASQRNKFLQSFYIVCEVLRRYFLEFLDKKPFRFIASGILILLILVFFVAKRLLMPSTKADFVIQSVPSGARLLIGSRDTGLHTPTSIKREYITKPDKIKLQLDSYLDWEGYIQKTVTSPFRVHLEAKTFVFQPESLESKKQSNIKSERQINVKPRLHHLKKKSQRKKSTPKPVGTLAIRSQGLWVDVYWRRKKLGTTPIHEIELPAGTHQLQISNLKAGIDQKIQVRIRAGEITRRTLILNGTDNR